MRYFLMLTLFTICTIPKAAEAYLVPLLGASGVVGIVVVVLLFFVFLIGFVIYHNIKKRRRMKQKRDALTQDPEHNTPSQK